MSIKHGRLIHGKTTSLRVGGKERRNTPRKDQYIVSDSHIPIISVEEFERAQFAIRDIRFNSIRQSRGNLLTGKIRCGNCRLSMTYQNITEVVLVCSHKIASGKKSTCEATRYDAKRIEGQVWYSLKKQIEHFEKLAYVADAVRNSQVTNIATELKTLQKNVESKKAERVRAYENYHTSTSLIHTLK